MDILKKGCLVHLCCSIWGGRIKLPQQAIHVAADPAFVNATKHLLDRDCLRPITQIRNKAKGYIYAKTLPFAIPGMLFIPKEMISEVDSQLKIFEAEINDAVDTFVLQYDTYKAEAMGKLNGLYNPLDYPDDIRTHFSFAWKFLVLDAPSRSHLLSPEIYENEKRKFQETIDDFRVTATNALRTKFADMVNRVVERLSGEKKVFKDTLISNIDTFLNDFDQLNINSDVELSGLTKQCRDIIRGANVDAIRTDDMLRSKTASDMSTVQGALNSMMRDRPVRKLTSLRKTA